MFGDWRILRTFNRNIRLALVAWALISFGYFGIQAVLLNLYLLRLGFGPEFIGILIASGQLIWALVALPAGSFGRRLGLRAALIAANGFTALGIGLLLMVEALPSSLWTAWLFSCWMLLWVGAALTTVNSTPYLMQVCSAEERNHAFSAQAAVMGLAGFAGSIIAGVLPELLVTWFGGSLDRPDPYRYALWLAPLAYMLSSLAWTQVRSVHVVEEAATVSASVKPLGLFVFFGLMVFLQTAGEGAVRAFFNVYLDNELAVPTARIGTILGIGQLLSIVAVLVAPGLLIRVGTARTLAFVSIGAGIAMLFLALFPHWLPASLSFIGMMSMIAIGGPARNIFSQEIVLPRWRTTTAAIGTIGIALGWASTAAAGGYIAVYVGFGGLFMLNALLAFASAMLLLGYARSRAKRVPAVLPS